jgi:polysaccharide export outer membrane protein
MNRKACWKSCIGLLLGLFSVAGCTSLTDLDPGTVKQISGERYTAVVERESVEVSLGEDAVQPEKEYLIGPNDILYVNVKGHPELSSPGIMVGGTNKVSGSRVDGLGRVHLPLAGSVPVAGMTIGQATEHIQNVFRTYLKEPWVVVEISEYRSKPLYLLGQFNAPGTYYMDRAYSLMEGLALGNGLKDIANLRSARIIRKGKTIPVDIYRLLQEGDQSQNTWLSANDVIFVPDDKNQNVFVFGAVKKAGPITMPNGRLTLAQALSSADINEGSARPTHVRIIRSLSPTRGELLVMDMEKIMKGEALPFPLMEGDIVYVPRSGVGSWNLAIQEILPSLQAISSLLQPFVQIKVLTRD